MNYELYKFRNYQNKGFLGLNVLFIPKQNFYPSEEIE